MTPISTDAPLILRYTEATSHPLAVSLAEAELEDRGLWVLMKEGSIDVLMVADTGHLAEGLLSTMAEGAFDEAAPIAVQWKGEDGARVETPAGPLSDLAEKIEAYLPKAKGENLHPLEILQDEIRDVAQTLGRSDFTPA